jgi:HD-GYP domain-containing protein (c-di-GMP phosphodiesterase class II)
MRSHTTLAHDMLKQIGFLQESIDIPHYHHERWDGKGYPVGLAGEDIPLPARMFAVVDVWDALTSDRPYRPAMAKEEARAIIEKGNGSHFDPQVVEQFLRMIDEEE